MCPRGIERSYAHTDLFDTLRTPSHEHGEVILLLLRGMLTRLSIRDDRVLAGNLFALVRSLKFLYSAGELASRAEPGSLVPTGAGDRGQLTVPEFVTRQAG